MNQTSHGDAISLQTLRRLPMYYNYLRKLQQQDVPYVSAAAIARELHLNEVQVRKDLAAASPAPGKPRIGFEVAQLMEGIAACIGYSNTTDAILVGAGQLGTALLSYQGFEEHGVRIVAAFDADEFLAGSKIKGKEVFSMQKLPQLCQRMHIHLAIITVPAESAQEVCDLLVENGILAICNFAPVHLKVPENILLHNENLASHLALLSHQLSEKKTREQKII